jgi:hypothetical protein
MMYFRHVLGLIDLILDPMSSQVMSTISYVITGAIVSATALVGYLMSRTQSPANNAQRVGAKLPPGPKQNIIIGNFADFPNDRWYINFSEWQKQFGM